MPNPEPERRRHVMYVTRHSEYHCRDRECVGVRDRSTGRWHRWHPALRTWLLGALGEKSRIMPRLEQGRRLVFRGDQMIVTSALLDADRPAKDCIFHYTSLCRAGEIDLAPAAR